MPRNRRQPTMQDIANRVGVSKALVSLVIRNAPGPSAETRQRVLDAAGELGYQVNRAAALMTAKRTHLIGVVAVIRSPFHAELIEDIVAEADTHGYEIVLGAVTPTHSEAAVLKTLLSYRCEALILLGPRLSETELADLAEGVPTVVVGRRTGCGAVDVVRTADRRGIAMMVDHLVHLGHQRISHVSGGAGAIPSERSAGYTRAMKRHGLADHIDVINGDLTEVAGIAAARTLLQRTRLPSAVVAANDQCAIGIVDQFLRAGVRVPEDISVAGYDDSALARLAHIDLTTVSQQPHEQAASAVKAVVSRLDNDRTERSEVVLEPRLVIRRTTGRLGPA